LTVVAPPELNEAVIEIIEDSVNVQVAVVPVHVPPLQPVKVDPASGVAVSVTDVPFWILAVQVEPQLMPEPVTVPEPVPDLVTVNVEVLGVVFGGTTVIAFVPPITTVPLSPVIMTTPDEETATARRFWVVGLVCLVQVVPSELVRMTPPSPTAMNWVPV
jgi:hypothetical protein